MSVLPKAGLGFAGLAGASGLGYLGVKQFSSEPKETFKSKYALAVKGFLNDDKVLGKKVDALNQSSASPKHTDLLEAQKQKKASNDAGAKEALKRGCSDIHDKAIESDFLEDFKNYCSFNNEDKIETGKTLVADKNDFTNHLNSFKGKKVEELQAGFKSIKKPSEDSSDETWKEAMLGECKRLSKEIFEGEIPNFKEFCAK
ncbi:hypothetical protein HF1_05130 [Mycoplasma haemofelis str. Langford 1]|uniref:Uncharacterized protein n=1 Tax=Mycoplasma haemofelis (strain Langford 1) TaxID=941640 RepID=E8ZHA0_MYCHL|nr:hypothetical protein [Mycoplasma haemofelis]CBY92521.1 hypothetical protein HF1_05130 [Mycoplasma haemofelis str. Langford 1]